MPASGPRVHAGCQRVHAGYLGGWEIKERYVAAVAPVATCNAFMQAVNAFVQAINAFMQAVNAFVQAINAFMQAVNAFVQAASSLQPPGVVWDLQYALY